MYDAHVGDILQINKYQFKPVSVCFLPSYSSQKCHYKQILNLLVSFYVLTWLLVNLQSYFSCK